MELKILIDKITIDNSAIGVRFNSIPNDNVNELHIEVVVDDKTIENLIGT